VIYAGLDALRPSNYNVNPWIVPNGGSGLIRQIDGTLRACRIHNGEVELGTRNPAHYNRPMTRDTFNVPFEVSGDLMLHSRLDPVVTYGDNKTPTWEWFPNFHPVFVDEDNNVVTGCSIAKNGWTASGQIDKTYGIPRSYVYVKRPYQMQFGRWYHWSMRVPKVGEHQLWVDGELVYHVIEKYPPAKWWGRPMHAALRLDFYDFSLRNLTGDDAICPAGWHD
jgi:hypothetical protein